MSHSFLVETGRWFLTGNWQDSNQPPMKIEGLISILWGEPNWFTMSTEITFPNNNHTEILGKYRGHFQNNAYQYTYVLKQNLLGKIEGEGWVAPNAIIQRYWVIKDNQRQGGFETFYKVNTRTYQMAGAIFNGHFITSTVEAELELQS